jgi:glycosyltransferase involved in cell wall biosynthesis
VRVVLAVIHHNIFGGPHNQVLRLHRPLLDRGWQTVAVLPAEPGNAAERLRMGGVEVLQIPLHRPRKTWRPGAHVGLVLGALPEVVALRCAIRSEGASLVQVFGPLYPHGAVAARLEGVPVVWQLLGTFAPAPVRLAMMPAVLTLSDVLMTTGFSVARAHPGARTLGRRLVPFYPPVDATEFRPDPARRAQARRELGVPPDGLLIGTVGNFNRTKGHEIFVRVASEIRRFTSKVHFRILGADTPTHSAYYESHVRDLAERLGLLSNDVLRFADPGARVAEFLPGFDIFVLTSRSEGVPTSALEAMSCGLPVVATDVGAVREVVKDGITGRVTSAGKPHAIASAILDLIHDPNLRSSMGFAGRRRAVEKYDTEVCVRTHLAAFEMAIAHRAGGDIPIIPAGAESASPETHRAR